MLSEDDLFPLLVQRLQDDRNIVSAVVFGSRGRSASALGAADRWSDIDLHLIVKDPARLILRSWAEAIPGCELVLHLVHTIPAGVQKVTILFTGAEINLILLPAGALRAVRLASRLGLHRHWKKLNFPLNEMATVMRGGYRFLKGERAWGPFYARVVRDLPGKRIDEAAAGRLADTFLRDQLRLRQKIERGELVSAQRILHVFLMEIIFKLLHEIRLRQGLPTFGEGRRVEKLLNGEELRYAQVSARLDADELRAAATRTLATLRHYMAELAPRWSPPANFGALLAPFEQK
jgi:hypothetical protein